MVSSIAASGLSCTVFPASSARALWRSVARRVAALEQQLQLVLFSRSRAGYKLTEAGEKMLPAVEQMESDAEAIRRIAELRLRRIAGILRVTASEGLANLFLNPCLREFTQLYPEIRVEVVVADRSLDIGRGEADVALRAGAQNGGGSIVVRKLREMPWSIYASRDYVRRHGCPECPEQMRGHSIVDGDGPVAVLPGAQWLRRRAGEEAVVAKSNSLTNLAAAVHAGLGLGALPCTFGERDGELIRCIDPPPELNSPLWLVTRAEIKDEPRVRTFTDFIAARTVSMRHLFELKPREEDVAGTPSSPADVRRN